MSIREQIPFLENLADIDERLRKLDEDLALRKGGLDAMRGEITQLDAKISESKASLQTMEKTRNELLSEARQMGQQVERSREKLGRSRNERETLAAQRELEELKKLIRDREIEAEKLDGLADRARTSIAENEARHGEISTELAGTAEGAMQTVTDKEAERVQLAAEREAAAKKLPPLLYRRYESVRQRRPRAIAKTHDGTCNGCHIAVPPMVFQKMLRLEEFEQCPNCRRILYYAPRATPESDGSSST